MVRIFVGVTHKPWFDSLSGLGSGEVNFWQPTGTGIFRALQHGDLFLFKLKASWNAIAGGGVFRPCEPRALVARLGSVRRRPRQRHSG